MKIVYGSYEELTSNKDINEIVDKWKFSPLRYLKNNKGFKTYLREYIQSFENDDSIYIYSNKVVIILKILEWESTVIGVKSASVNVIVYGNAMEITNELTELIYHLKVLCNKLKIQFLSTKIYTDDIHTLNCFEYAKFQIKDTQLVYTYSIENKRVTYEKNNNINVREATKNDLDKVKQVYVKSFDKHIGRFHSDIRIGDLKANKIYEKWVESSFNGYADRIYLAEYDSEVIGASIWKRQSQIEKDSSIPLGHYSIGAVDPEYKGRGVFRLLTQEGLRYCSDFASLVEGPTHINNYAVQTAYTKMGWMISDAHHTLHYWTNND